MNSLSTLLSMCVLPAATGFAGLDYIPSSIQSVASSFSFLDHASTIAASTTTIFDMAIIDPLATYKQALMTEPLATKMITGATLAACGDAIAQRREEGISYDPRRAASFAAFDSCYRALQHVLFPTIVKCFDGHWLLGAAAAVAAATVAALPGVAELVNVEATDPCFFGAMEQTLASQLVIVPFLYYPVFFSLTGFVQGLTVEKSIQRATENFIPLMKRNLIFWIPVQFVQFGFVEEGLQIPFLCVCGLAWTFILSVMAGSTKNYCVTGAEEGCQLPEEFFPLDGKEDYLDMNQGGEELGALGQTTMDDDEALIRSAFERDALMQTAYKTRTEDSGLVRR